jgi:hypothetical protein
LVWAELVSLGSFLEQDDDLRQEPNAFASPLDVDIRRPLMDLLQTAGPWLRRFPTARQLDEDHAAFQTPREAVEPARELVAAAETEDVVEEDDATILDGALRSGEQTGTQSLKARNWGVLSVRNLLVSAIGIAAAGIVTGAFEQIGNQVAEHSILAQKTIRLVLSSEDALGKFLSNLPADIRSAVRALIDDLRRQRDSGFPLPRAPEEKRTLPSGGQRRPREK